MTPDQKRDKVAQLRTILARFRGGRFEATGSGGANGMMFFVDRESREFYIGGMKPEIAERVARALNGLLELLYPE